MCEFIIELLSVALDHVEKVRPQFLSLRHYTVLLSIQSFESTAKTTSSATTDVAADAAVLLVVIAQTVAFDVGSEDGFP